MRRSPPAVSALRSPPEWLTPASTTSTLRSAGLTVRTLRRRTVLLWKLLWSRTRRRLRKRSTTSWPSEIRSMASEITIPRLGWNMDEGVFAGWLKHEGDVVGQGEAIFSLEGDKATQDVEAIDGGILRIPATAPKVGDRVRVGQVIAYLVEPGEPDPSDLGARREPGQAATSEPLMSALTSARDLDGSARSVHADGSPEEQSRRRGPKCSPLARRVARELGIDWTQLRGSGRAGRIRKRDVLDAHERNALPSEQPAGLVAKSAGVREPHMRSVKVDTIRRTIATRLLESQRTTAAVTLTTTVDASNMVGLRTQFKALDPTGRTVPSYTDFAVKLVALALQKHPLLNSRWDGERIVVLAQINIGIAVDTDAGLLVPVIRDVAGLSLREVSTRARELTDRALSRRIQASELHGGTFTITNLGAFGVEFFTPIINPPECAVLGL